MPLSNKLYKLKIVFRLSDIVKLLHVLPGMGLYLNVFLIFAETVLLFLSLYFLKSLISSVSVADPVWEYLALSGISCIGYFLTRSYGSYFTEKQSLQIAAHVNEQIHRKSASVSYGFYEQPAYYDMLKRAREGGADRPVLYITHLADLVKNICALLAVTAVLVFINWQLPMLIVLFLFPTVVMRIVYAKKIVQWRLAQTGRARLADYYSTLLTTPEPAKEIRSFQLGKYFRERYQHEEHTSSTARLALQWRQTRLEIITFILVYAGIYICIGYLSFKTLTRDAQAADITLFLLVFMHTLLLLYNIAQGVYQFYQDSNYMRQIFDFLALKDNPTDTLKSRENISLLPQSFSLALHNVSFRYPNATADALRNVHMCFPPGRIIGIAGMNGAGKSTLIKLLGRLYKPTAGDIRIDNQDISEFSPEVFHRLFSFVFQDFTRFHATVADNIRIGDISVPQSYERMVEAACIAGAEQFIEQLPQQYDTLLGSLFEEGHDLSTGQWQKIAIARCLYAGTPILVLDEATSALDAASETALLCQLRQMRGNPTVIVISHRHATLQLADYIYFLSDGTVAEEGSDSELCMLNGVYAQLFNKQTNGTYAS